MQIIIKHFLKLLDFICHLKYGKIKNNKLYNIEMKSVRFSNGLEK